MACGVSQMGDMYIKLCHTHREAVAELMEEVVGEISDENVVCVGDIIDTSNQDSFLRYGVL